VRIVVPVLAGSSNDQTARIVAPLLAARLHTNVIVENRPGASGLLGAATVAKGPRDGSQILLFSTTLVSAAAMMRSPPLDVMKDLAPVAALSENPLTVTVSSKSSIRTPADLVAAARAKPDALTHGSGGVGTMGHIAQELFDKAANIQIRHIPYRGNAGAVTDLLSGNIDLVFANASGVNGYVKAGQARIIGVTSREPNPAFPGVPTMNTVAPGYELALWVGTWLPAGTSPAIIERYNRELVDIAHSKELSEQLKTDGAVPLSWTPEQFAARMRTDFDAFKKLAAEKNIVVE
jgi:tripartite-type tricarboxylate transporter receptor subunit TctC